MNFNVAQSRFEIYLPGNTNGLWKKPASEGDVDSWAADDDLNVGVQWTGGENLGQLGDGFLGTIHLPVTSDAEFT